MALRHILVAMAMAVWPLAASADAPPIKIGSVLALTGPAAFLGQDEEDAQQLAVSKLNAQGGINGRKIDLIVYDSQSETAAGIAAVRRLISQDHVDFVVSNGGTSGIDLATGPILNAAKIPTISLSGSAEIVYPVDKHRQWIFKATLDDDEAFDRLADYFKKKHIEKVALLYDTSGFGQSAADVVKSHATAYGWQVSYQPFSPSDTDLTAQLTSAKNSGAQALICWTATPAGVVFIHQAKQLGLGDRLLVHGFGFISQRFLNLAGNDVNGLILVSGKFVVGPDLPAADPLKASILELNQNFQAVYHRQPSFYVAQAYDAVLLAAHALSIGGTDKEKVREALEDTHDFPGTGGVFNFSPTRHSGLSKNDLVIVDYRQGKFHLVDY